MKHERPFICTFSFAGCDQTFGSKNEWKRHVNSQHMHLACWKCDLASCKDRHAVFNRKDLHGQHLKRMHQPQAPARLDLNCISDVDRIEIQEARDNWIRNELPEIQDRCYTIWREPPSQSNCEICRFEFTGPKAWDTKMEHVGKHYENSDKPSTGGPAQDDGLVRWALQHGLIEERISYEVSSPSEQSFDEKDDPCSEFPPSRKLVENKYQFTKLDPFSPKTSAPASNTHSWYAKVDVNSYHLEYPYRQ